MEGKKRQFTKEFKKEAVEYSLQSEKTIEEVAYDLGISSHNLNRWRKEYRKRGELAFPGHGKENLTPKEEKVRKLQKELNDIRIERDILKKALAIFTKKP
jgi:transposase